MTVTVPATGVGAVTYRCEASKDGESAGSLVVTLSVTSGAAATTTVPPATTSAPPATTTAPPGVIGFNLFVLDSDAQGAA